MARAKAVPWTREHNLIALNLYGKLPFGKLHRGNPQIVDVAAKMGRTPNSLAMKLCNFAALDPVLQARGIRGLSRYSKSDVAVWEEFQNDFAELALQSEELLHQLYNATVEENLDFLDRETVRKERAAAETATAGIDILSTVKTRRGQQYFRQVVINAYGGKCCITGIDIPRLLVASHIRPWSDYTEGRLLPSNGLCLSALHDAAFDSGLMTLDENCRVVLSREIKDRFPHESLNASFQRFEGERIQMPTILSSGPNKQFIEHHRKQIFKP